MGRRPMTARAGSTRDSDPGMTRAFVITAQMLEIYVRFGGDVDGFARMASARERAVIDTTQWWEITTLLQEVHALKTGAAAPGYAEEIRRRLAEQSESLAVEDWLCRIA